MSNASAAARAATKPKAAAVDADEPELPFDHPERVVAALFAKDSPVLWKVPLHLGQRLPFATFGAAVVDDALVVTCALPVTAPTAAEQSRFRLAPEAPRLELTLSASVIQTALSAMLMHGIAGDECDAIARIVGHAIAEPLPLPKGARPFIERWIIAVRELSSVLCEMWWQASALESNRDAVHRARKLMLEQARDLPTRWTAGRPEHSGAARA